MSIVAINLQKTLHRSPNVQLQQQPTRIFAINQKQLRKQKSIGPTTKSEQKHVTKKEIKSKQLIRPTTVAAATAEVTPENKKDRPQSQETEEIIAKELENVYLNEQEINAIKDYQIYQNGNVNEFFKKNHLETANTVADICLVNDHFILVKMPEQETSSMNINKFNEAATGRKDIRDLKDKSKDHQKENKKLCRYLRSKRNRITKITPIHEEPEDLNEDEEDHKTKSNCLKMHSCWQANEQEVETYQTQTKIYKTFTNTTSNCQKIVSPQSAAEKPENLDLKNDATDIPTISGSLLKSSLQYQVALHPYGALLESPKKDHTTFNHLEIINRTRHRKCPRLKSFYWLLRPFRGKCCKTEPKIQAVVYKTYFVKWTKPPDTLTNGYGVKSSKSAHVRMSVLRRCRSAFF